MKTFNRILIASALAVVVTGSASGNLRLGAVTNISGKKSSGRRQARASRHDSGTKAPNVLLNTNFAVRAAKTVRPAKSDKWYLEHPPRNPYPADAGYRDFLPFFKDTDIADCDCVIIKIAEIHMRSQPDSRGQSIGSYALPGNTSRSSYGLTDLRRTEFALTRLIQLHPHSVWTPLVKGYLNEVRSYLADQELQRARVDFDVLHNFSETEQITEHVLTHYPNFPRLDEALYYHALSLAGQGKTEAAIKDLTRLQAGYPDSSYAEMASQLLRKLKGKADLFP